VLLGVFFLVVVGLKVKAGGFAMGVVLGFCGSLFPFCFSLFFFFFFNKTLHYLSKKKKSFEDCEKMVEFVFFS
jgi:hypothetical protein